MSWRTRLVKHVIGHRDSTHTSHIDDTKSGSTSPSVPIMASVPKSVFMEDLRNEESKAIERCKYSDNYRAGYSENWARLITREKNLKSVLRFYPEEQADFIDGLWELVRALLNSEDLTWDTMVLFFKDGYSTRATIRTWSELIPVRIDILDSADRAVAFWHTLKCGNPKFAMYNADSIENRD
ncbi:MAG: hypothetical protein ISS70_15795 [Phycisphaerae bacterium]|nr:hypothetical protein [Phycisphaerae bacterium]